ncbi:phosphotransferase family protein [Pseudomonas kielensis]|uniref:phosphotransferase family protein n=1 Tax=Pseudomonas kielensis TaxID=2762577 RepID=UPI0038A8B13A
MDEITIKTLSSTEAFVEKLLASGILGGDLLTEALMARTALGYELARGCCSDEALLPIRVLERQLVSELSEYPGTVDCAKAVRRDEQWQASIGASLTSVMEGLARHPLDAGQERIIASRLREFLVRYHELFDPAISHGTNATYQGGRGDGQVSEACEDEKITPQAVQRDLKANTRYTDVQVTDMRQLMGGYSKETFILDLSDATGERREVLRKDGVGLPTGSSVVNEFQVLREVARLGLPVPTPLHLQVNAENLGTAYMLVDYVAGQSAHLTVPMDPASRQRWADSILDSLVMLHRETLQTDRDIRDLLRAEIDELRQRVRDRERHAHPGIACGLSWLQSHLSDLEGRPACRVHGDVGFHNMLMADDKLVALLDWEFSHISDPVEDLRYVKPFIEQLDVWPWFIEQYEQRSGMSYDARAARYFNVWKEVRNAVACQGSLNSLLMPGVRNLALCVAGNLYLPKFEIGILDAIVDANTVAGDHHV